MLSEPPGADPHAGWCGGRRGELGAYPIGIAVCIGDGRPYNTALIVLDPDVAAGRGPRDPETVTLVQQAVDRANERLARVEQIKRFIIVEEDWQAGGEELTPTMKLKRRPITDKYAAEIEKLYAT